MTRTIKIPSSLATFLIILCISGLAFADVTAVEPAMAKTEGLAENYGWIALARRPRHRHRRPGRRSRPGAARPPPRSTASPATRAPPARSAAR